MLPQITQYPANATRPGELFQNQANRVLRLFVGIELQFAVGADNVTGERLAEAFAATGTVQTASLHPLLKLVQLDTSHKTFDGQEQAIIEIVRMI
jgi:hypothetical protein